MQQEAPPSSGMIELLSASQGVTEASVELPQAEGDESEELGGEGRGRKRSSSGRPQDERVAAVQEKNRKAQKRFRERQKSRMSTMEAQLEDYKSQVDRIREENSLLAGRNAVLEKVLALREEQLKASHQGSHQGSLQGSLQGFHPSPQPAHPASLPSVGGALSMALPANGPPSGLDMHSDPATGASAPAAALMSMAAGGPQLPLPLISPLSTYQGPVAIKKEGVQPHERWLAMVADLVDLQSNIHASPTTENHSRLVERATQAASLSAHLSPTSGTVFGHGNVDMGMPPDQAKWANLAVAMQVSDMQREAVQPLLAAVRERIAPIEAAQASLAAAAAANSGNAAVHAELKANLERENHLLVQFAEHLFTQVLTPLQFGIAAVQSHPFFVDSLALADAITSTAP